MYYMTYRRLHSSVSQCVNFLCLNTLLQTLSAVKRLHTHGMQLVQGRGVSLGFVTCFMRGVCVYNVLHVGGSELG